MKGNIGACDLIIANMFDVANGQFNTPRMGATMAALSPQNRSLLDTISPVRDEYGNLSRGADGKPKVKIMNYLNQNEEVSDSPTCDGGAAVPPVEEEFVIDKYAELGFKFSHAEWQRFCQESFDNLETGPANKIRLKKNIKRTKLINWMNTQIAMKIGNIMNKVENDATDALLAGVGVNAVYGNATAQNVLLFDNATTMNQRPHLYDELGKIMRKNELSGTPIVIGGENIATFADRFDVACCSDGGIDYAKMGGKMKFEYYYSDKLEAKFGANHFTVLAPGSFGFVTYPRYEHIMFANGEAKHGTSEYGVFSVPEFSADNSGGRTIDFDLKVKKIDCDPDFGNEESWLVIPSISYDFFVKPAGFRYGYGPLQNVNGIMRYIGVIGS